jgi:hypothetical protein
VSDDLFTQIGEGIADATMLILSELWRLIQTPWQWRLYADTQGVPDLPAGTIARIATLQKDNPAQLIQDAISIVQGLRDSIMEANAADGQDGTVEEAIEILVRMFLPIALVSLHRSEYHKTYAIVAAIALADDSIADQSAGLTAERLVRIASDLKQVALDDQEKRLFVPMALPLVLRYVLPKILDVTTPNLAAGWESELPLQIYNGPKPWETTPIWMAHRTSSIHWPIPDTFKLDRYANPPEAAPQQGNVGITVVPVPALRTYDGPPVDQPPPIADARGPAMYLQIDGDLTKDIDLGHGFTLRTRGTIAAGLEFALGAVPPLPGGAEDPGAGSLSAGFEIELGWGQPISKDPPPPSPTSGANGGANLSLDGAAIFGFGGGGVTTDALTKQDWGFGVRLQGLRFSISPSSAVLQAVLGQTFKTSLDLGVLLVNPGSEHQQLLLEGGSGLDLYRTVRWQLGNSWLGMTVDYIRASATFEKQAAGAKLGVALTTGIELSFLRATLIVDGLGLGATASSRQPDGNLLGLGHFDSDLVTPKGLGLKLDWGPVKGGGFFSHDAQLDRYAGAVEIQLAGIGTIRGIGFTEPRPVDPTTGTRPSGHTTVVSLTIEIPNGWPVSGIGLMIGLHRSANVDAIRAALPAGGIDALMFPSDPLGQAGALVNSLATMFPPALADADSHVAGVMLKGTYAGGLVVIKLGFLVQWGVNGSHAGTRILVPFSGKVSIHGVPSSVLYIELDGLGDYDATSGEIEVQGVLRNSKLCGGDLVGGLVYFYGDITPESERPEGYKPKHQSFFSIGGYHPSYFGGKGPARARVEDRLGLTIAYGNSVKLQVRYYLAAVPSGWHLGYLGQLTVLCDGFGVDGKIWFDGVATWDFDNFTFDVGGELSLILFGETIASMSASAELRGRHPWNINGTVSIKVLWWSVSYPFGKPLSDTDASQPTTADPSALIVAALADPTSYPNATPALVTLNTGVKRTGIWTAPETSLVFTQGVLPLDTQIDRIGATAFATPRTFALGPVQFGSGGSVRSVTNAFAPGAFLSLDTDAAVQAPPSETWPSGFSTGDDAVACGDDQGAAAQLDEVVVDRAQLVPPQRRRFPVPGAVWAAWNTVSTVPGAAPITIRPAVYTSHLGDQPATFGSAWARRGLQLRRTESG